MTYTICTTCGFEDTYRSNGDIAWCFECGDTEGLVFLEDEQPNMKKEE